jgi:hypothetical protein
LERVEGSGHAPFEGNISAFVWNISLRPQKNRHQNNRPLGWNLKTVHHEYEIA